MTINIHRKVLLILEIIGFTPISSTRLMGLLLSPHLIRGPLHDPLAPIGVVAITALIAIGGIRLTCLFGVATYFLNGKNITQIRKCLLTGTGLACLTLLAMLLLSDGVAWKSYPLMPLACTAHLVYLARDQFFSSSIK